VNITQRAAAVCVSILALTAFQLPIQHGLAASQSPVRGMQIVDAGAQVASPWQPNLAIWLGMVTH
jgi:hypothetical protein